MNPNYILYAIPAFLLFIFIEAIIGKLKGRPLYRFNDAITNINIGIGSRVVGLFNKFVLFGAYMFFYEHFAIFNIEFSWWSFILLVVLFDFLFYWAHRLSHTINFLWAGHVVHHQSEEYNLSVALRQPWAHDLFSFIIFLPIPLLGFEPSVFLAAAAFVTIYQYWIHTRAIKKMPNWFEYIFNTPSHHRVHHGRNPKYIDRNHAGFLIIWDRLFGTFTLEEEEPSFGITTQFTSWNPAWANLAYYNEMWQNMKQMPQLKDKLKMIVARPGWLPDYLGGYQAPPEIDPSLKKYDKTASPILNLYILAQFLIVVWATIAFMKNFDEFVFPFHILSASIIILTMMTCGAIFEGKKWALYAEYVKLLLAIIGLNTMYYYLFAEWLYISLIISSVVFVILNIWFTLSWVFDRNSRKILFGNA